MVQDFIQESSRALHFNNKYVNCHVPSSSIPCFVYLVSPSKRFRADGSYENYSKTASFKIRNCECRTPICYSTGMTGMFPVGYEVATYLDSKNHLWVMPCRLTVLSMQDKESAFGFFSNYFDKPLREMIIGASRTTFYTVMSIQLNQVTVASTKALMNMDLIIFTLCYVIRNELLVNDIFRSYCIPDDAWNLLTKFDPVWSFNPSSWLGRFLAYDALHAEDPEIREKFSRMKLPLISCLSKPHVTHPQAINLDRNFVLYKTEPIGTLIMDDGDSFWLVNPMPEFLSSKALVPSESLQLLIITETYTRRENVWLGYFDELRMGRWRNNQFHREFVIALDSLLQTYF